jgi:exopolysaccharide production protein ExoQ
MAIDNPRIQAASGGHHGGPWMSAPRTIACTLLVLASALAGIGVATPEMWAVLALGLGAVVACSFLLLQPRVALMMSFALVAAATTKFRDRETTALLLGDLDTQIIFELMSYGIILMVVVVNGLLYLSPRHKPRLPLTRVEVLLGAYVVLAGISVLWSVDPFVTAPRAVQLFILYALCLVTVRVLAPRQVIRALTFSLVAYVFLASLLALLFPWARLPSDVFSWFRVHPGVAATFAAIAAIFVLAQVLFSEDAQGRHVKRAFLWSLIGVLGLIMIASHARGPLLAFAASALAVWSRKHLQPLMAGVLLCLAVVVSTTALHALGASTGSAQTSAESDNSIGTYLLRGQSGEQFLGLSGRVELWEYVGSLVRERPLLGYGYLSSRSLLLERFPWAGTSHGALPEVLLNLGLVGAILLGWVVVGTLASAFRSDLTPAGITAWNRAAYLGILVFLFIGSLAGDTFAGPASYILFVFLMAVVMLGHHGAVRGAEGARAVIPHQWRAALTPRHDMTSPHREPTSWAPHQ